MAFTVRLISSTGETKTVLGQEGENLYGLLLREDAIKAAPCAGRCLCGKCGVRISGEAPPPRADERSLLSEKLLGDGYRLACAVKLTGDLDVYLADGSAAASVMAQAASAEGDLGPWVSTMEIALPEPSLEDSRADIERLFDALGRRLSLSHGQCAALPGVLRGNQMRLALTLFDGDKVLDIGERPQSPYGAAVDIGTTTIAAYLVSLDTGDTVEVATALNPQRAFGADVISRAQHAMQGKEALSQLHTRVCAQIDSLIAQMCAARGLDTGCVKHVLCVGNPIMQHLMLGLPVDAIAVMPFAPVFSREYTLPAPEAGLDLPGAMLTMAPLIAGYVGGDTLAAALACDMDEYEGIALLIDIGTNGEIMLGGKREMLCCSTAAGPALEGAHIRCGTGGVTGAIDHVSLNEGVKYTTIGGAPAIGLCGSGLVDSVAQLLEVGALDEAGRLDEDAFPETIRAHAEEIDGKCALRISGEGEGAVVLTQRDIREVQLAKGAIAAGIEVLMREMGIGFSDISKLYLAGGFGNYMDVGSACRIGLLPRELEGVVEPIGNAAGVGAQRLLRNRDNARRVEALRTRTRSVELSLNPDFQDLFIERMMFE